MIGARFLLQGCDPATGLDCVGLIWAAYAAAGRRLVRPHGYPLRGWAGERVEAALMAAGFVPAGDRARAGDVVLIALPAGQFHLGLMGRDIWIHAHAGLRRTVEAPIDAAVRTAPRWRLRQGGSDGDFGADGGRRADRRAGGCGDRGGAWPTGRCRDPGAEGARGAAACRPEGAGINLWPADTAIVRDDARRGQRDLGNRPDRAAREARRRQGAAVDDRI